MAKTITIDELQFVVAPEKVELPAPVERPKPKRTYCPDCEPKPRPVGTCTPSRAQTTGMVARRCKKHAWAKYHDDVAKAKEKMYLDRLHRRS